MNDREPAGSASPGVLVFAPFRLDLRSGELWRGKTRVHLRPQSLEVLRTLLKQPGQIVPRDRLVSRLWPQGEVFVDYELGLNSVVRRLRRALGDSAKDPRFIETLPRQGYRFIASVGPGSDLEPGQKAGPRSLPRTLLAAGLTVLAIGISLAGIITGSRLPRPNPAPVPSEIVLAIEPFERTDQEPYEPHLATALAQEILVEVGSSSDPQGAILAQWRDRRHPPERPRDSPELYRLSGSFRKIEDDRFEITFRLHRPATGTVLEQQAFEYPAIEAGLVPQDLAREIAEAVVAALPGHRIGRLSDVRRPVNAQAYDEYLKGLYLRANDRSIELQAALEHFKRAVDLDPDFIQGFSALATTHLRLALRSSSAGHWQQASTAAHQAIERDSDLAEAHLAKGLVELYREWDFAAAEASLRRALELAPGWGDSHSALASYLATLGHYDEAIPRAKLARRLDPAKFSLSSDLCWYLIHASRFADAELECSRALELEPEHALSLLGQAEAARRLGNFQLALESTARALRTSIPAQDASSSITPASRLDRLWQEASAAESTPIHSTSPYFAAVAAALAGHEEKAIALLTRARDRRYPALLHFRTDPRLESIKSHPEYAQLVESIGFPDP